MIACKLIAITLFAYAAWNAYLFYFFVVLGSMLVAGSMATNVAFSIMMGVSLWNLKR